MQLRNKAELGACSVQLEIEIGADEVNRAFERIYSELSRKTAIPGFRKGKAPMEILTRYFPEEQVKDAAAQELLPTALQSAVEEAGIRPFGSPELEIVQYEKGAPLIFKANVELAPRIQLGQYIGLEVERAVPQVTDQQIEQEINTLRERTCTFEPVEGRPVQRGDQVFLRMLDISDPDDKEDVQKVIVGENLPSFDEGLIGMTVGEEKVIEITYPDDFRDKELAGKKRQIRTEVLGIEEKKMPEGTDEWAKTLGSRLGKEIESLDELRAQIRREMEQSAATLADRQVEARIVDKIIEGSEILYPESIRENEVEHRIEDLKNDLKKLDLTMDEYLAQTGRTMEQLYEEIRRAADRDLKIALVLGEIAEKENITVQDEEVENEIRRLADERRIPVESFKAYLDKTEAGDGIRERLLRRKVLDFLVGATNIKTMAPR